jgi:hypothetical protein|tara:strand:- start:5962 stop:6399 length:438 start_codon:yes stop_codon:yes gene_type:complete
MELIQFRSAHAQSMVNSIMNDKLTQVDESYHELLNNLEVEDMSFTAVKDDKFICSGGIIPVWDNVYEGWVMASNDVWQNKISSARVIKKGLEVLIDNYKVVRLQTAVKKDFELGKKFAVWLGMKEEGLMKKYQNNEDYIRFARVV